jgi:RecA-family ATPase
MRAVRISRFIEEVDNVEWLIEGLLPSVGFTLLIGKQGLGKTTFAAQLCAALQTGTPFLGRKTIQRNILYVQADSPPDEWKLMLKRIAPGSKGYTLVDVPSKSLEVPEYIHQIRDKIDKVKPGFVVFDSLYNLTAKSISTEAVLIPVNQMKDLCGDLPWLLIHHPPHGETRSAGHHSLPANCSNEWHLLRNKLEIAKGRLIKDKEILMSRNEHGLWIPLADDTDYGGDYIMNRPMA